MWSVVKGAKNRTAAMQFVNYALRKDVQEKFAPRALLMPTTTVGSVTLARRGDPPHDKPVVHWLLVLPGYRRRGIGQLLTATLEAAVWDAGGRQVWLETHAGWADAVRLYTRLGYRPASD